MTRPFKCLLMLTMLTVTCFNNLFAQENLILNNVSASYGSFRYLETRRIWYDQTKLTNFNSAGTNIVYDNYFQNARDYKEYQLLANGRFKSNENLILTFGIKFGQHFESIGALDYWSDYYDTVEVLIGTLDTILTRATRISYREIRFERNFYGFSVGAGFQTNPVKQIKFSAQTIISPMFSFTAHYWDKYGSRSYIQKLVKTSQGDFFSPKGSMLYNPQSFSGKWKSGLHVLSIQVPIRVDYRLLENPKFNKINLMAQIAPGIRKEFNSLKIKSFRTVLNWSVGASLFVN